MIRKRKLIKAIALFLLVQFSAQTFLPAISYALTSGPSQPEFSSFEPVATTNMVEEFSGDFTYNLPVLEVPGPQGSSYPVALSYHSGVTPEEESSWVGYGWTLNPGAINRGMRGIPDDYKGKDIKFHNKMPKNWTGTVGSSVGFGEVFGVDLQKLAGTQLSGSVSIRYNNYRGFGYNAGVGVSLGKGLVSMGYNVSDGEGSYSLNVNPYAVLSWNFRKQKEVTANFDRFMEKFAASGKFQQRYASKMENKKAYGGNSVSLAGSSYGVFSYTEASRPNIVNRYEGKSFNVTVGLEGNVAIVPVGATASVYGSYSYQNNIETESVPAYGFMYSSEANNGHLMDYHVEHEKDFNKRDVFLGVPFNDADNFSVTGEGIGGGFSLHNKRAGHYGPRRAESVTDIYNVGGEIGAGWTFGPGADIGKGSHTLTVEDWNRDLSDFSKADDNTVDEPVFFRFNNDLGGEWGNNHDDAPFRAGLSGSSVSLTPGVDHYNVSDERNPRSSFIGFHRNKEMESNGEPSYSAYSKNKRINILSGRGLAERADLIGELAVFNESGNRYVYGLPVYARKEKSLSFSARGVGRIDNSFLAYTNAPNTSIKVGEEKESAYATTYLLTEITTPDYLDLGEVSNRGESGPTDDDLGGYTRFNYESKTNTGSSDWFVWRAPFRGLLYNKNSHSDPQDDMVSYSEGEKELYYLHSIETKTHVAFFVTSGRKDGREASSDAFNSTAGPGAQEVYQLDKIELYALAECQRDTQGDLSRDTWGSPIRASNAKAVKTVHFVYDHSLTTGLPNSTDGSGKLTLKRVYFEYNGITRTRISPYEFKYQYPDAAGYNAYPSKYRSGDDNVTTGYATLSAGAQNPSYSPFLNDGWGNYQKDGLSRFSYMQPWVNQKPVADFDPAAWHLKVIKLPSGGEIHVQYEQDDYSYVQDQEAHVMAALKEEPGEAGSLISALLHRYYIDVTSIGLGATTADLSLVRDMIRKRYVENGKKIYFRFLYSLIGNDVPNHEICNAEYLTGYATVVNCDFDAKGLYVELSKSGGNRMPREVCKDFVKAQRLGKVDPNATCDPSRGVTDPNDARALVNQLLSLARGIALPDDLCMKINPIHSYFRIPTPLAKKGGGTRVKRLMMFDQGLEGNAVLYGSEYIYKTKDGDRIISSGVATNEPQTMREENILVDFVARKGQKLWSRIVAGRDLEQAEGPLGESILPGPSVGYSRVTVRNIHSGKTNPGFSVSEFYTARDYPVTLAHPDKKQTMTDLKRTDKNPIPVMIPFRTVIKTKTSATQGFSFVLNNMHGQPRSSASYSGPYTDVIDLFKSKPVSRITYEYYKPGEKIPVMSSLYDGVKLKNPGREVDITFAQRSVKEVSNDVNVEVDLQLTIIPLAFIVLVIPYPTAIPSFSNIEGELNTHATTKVVRYPVMMKKTTTVQDGIEHTEENLAFDEYTGRVVAVRSTDEFKGGYLSQSIPANWEYTEMGGKWKSEGKIIRGSFTSDGTYLALGTDPCTLAEFTRGDQLRLGDENSTAVYYVTERDYINNRLKIEKARGGMTTSASFNEITILHTGRTNQLQQQAGALTLHHEQKDKLTPPIVDKTNRYESAATNNFAASLNQATRGLSGEGSFTLAGPYTQLDMSGFADKLTTCSGDLTNATVKQMKFLYVQNGGQVKLQLMSFVVECAGTDITVKAEGWE